VSPKIKKAQSIRSILTHTLRTQTMSLKQAVETKNQNQQTNSTHSKHEDDSQALAKELGLKPHQYLNANLVWTFHINHLFFLSSHFFIIFLSFLFVHYSKFEEVS
jgi:hypothetical protein